MGQPYAIFAKIYPNLSMMSLNLDGTQTGNDAHKTAISKFASLGKTRQKQTPTWRCGVTRITRITRMAKDALQPTKQERKVGG